MSGWRATLIILLALVVLALILTALFWLAMVVAALGAVAWFNLLLLPRIAARLRIPELLLAVALAPILAAAGLGVAGMGGLVAGCAIWILAVALPRATLWRLRRRIDRRIATHRHVHRIVDARFTTRNSG